MRTPIIAANWKMNLTAESAVSFVRAIRYGLNSVDGVDSVICPPFIALPAVSNALLGTRIAVGAQNMHFADKGAYTGEIAPAMLVSYCQYVILGHSERRAHFGETDDAVNKKVHAALGHQLTPIICVGESVAQNEAGKTDAFVGDQVRAACAGMSAEQAAGCIIAYEPIWAIGTGKSASPTDAGRIIGLTVRRTIAELFGEGAAAQIRIQYGGSVDESNIADFMRQADIDGALVGSASLKPSFVDLVRNARR